MTDHMIACPRCGSDQVLIARDMMATRKCAACGKTWLPVDEEPDYKALYLGAQVELKQSRDMFQRIFELCVGTVNTAYTLKLIQKMAEDAARLARQKETT